jgi:hypothetical protein
MTRRVTEKPIAGEEKNRARERGVALLTMVFCSALFMLLGLSLTFSSMTEFKMSTEYEAREQALFIADAGFNLTQVIWISRFQPRERRWSISIEIPCVQLRPFRSILQIRRLPSGPERSRVC